MGKGEWECQVATKRSVGDEDNGLKGTSNASRSSSSSCASVPHPHFASPPRVLPRLRSSLLRPRYPRWFGAALTHDTHAIYIIMTFFLASRCPVICARIVRVHAHWHASSWLSKALILVVSGMRTRRYAFELGLDLPG